MEFVAILCAFAICAVIYHFYSMSVENETARNKGRKEVRPPTKDEQEAEYARSKRAEADLEKAIKDLRSKQS